MAAERLLRRFLYFSLRELIARNLPVAYLAGRCQETVVARSSIFTNGLAMIDSHTISVQKLRLKKGWSQEQLAMLSGLSVRTVQRLERGHRASPETLKAVASVFEIDFNQLMEPPMEPDSKFAASKEEELAFIRVRKLKGFYVHFVQYFIVVSMLSIINLIYTPTYFWAGWTIFGWGTGVLVHGLLIFDKLPFLNADWERSKVEKYLGREL